MQDCIIQTIHPVLVKVSKPFYGTEPEKIQRVIKIVLEHYGLEWSQVDKKTRKRNIIEPRQMLMYMLRTKLKLKLEEIASMFSAKYHHTTVLNAVKTTKNLIETGFYLEDYTKISKKIS